MKEEIKNAIITSASLTTSDRNLLTSYICFDYGDSGAQCFGGYALYLPKSFKHHELKTYAGHFIWRVMEVAGVEDWKNLVGKSIRVDATHERVHGIGHIIKDDWFYPEQDFKKEAEAL